MNDLERLEAAAAMHAAVSARLRLDPLALLDADNLVTGVGQAVAYAPDNKWLMADAWVSQVVADAARDDDGIMGLPVDGGAVIVRACEFSTQGEDGWHRKGEPLRADGGPTNQVGMGWCDRCELSPVLSRAMGIEREMKSLIQFHISSGRFVVEFGVCDDCAHALTLTVGPILQAVTRGSV